MKKTILTRVPESYIDELDRLKEKYGSRNKAVIHALEMFFQNELPDSDLKELKIPTKKRKLSDYEIILKIRSGGIDIFNLYA